MSTIKDIARLAGVGLGTVSRVLNGSSQVSPQTVEKVKEAARQLNYRPNAAARSLARGDFSKHTLGVALPVAVHPFYLEILKGIYEAVAEKNYNILIFNLGQKSEEVYEHILQESLPGVLVVAEALPPSSREQLTMQNIPFHYIDYFSESDSSFYINNRSGGEIAARHFIQEGWNKVVYIGENADTQQQDQRFTGFRDTLDSAGIIITQDIRIPISEADAYKATKKLIESGPPHAIFYFCDELAYGGLRAVQESKSDIHILGYDDRDASQYLGLSSISQPAFEMGYQAALSLIDTMYESPSRLIQKSFSPELIKRNT